MQIRLKQLHLENFKCHKSLTIDFGGKNVSIYGNNATGKTSVYDAFVWLLFGKDSDGKSASRYFKPVDSDGNVLDHQAVTEVEAVLLVDGEEVSLRRTLREVWTTRRGDSEAVYSGNTSEYFVDGVPCKANAYKERVSELVDEERFKLLTTVKYFPVTLKWQQRREVLFDLSGTLDDRAIMQTDERFTPLLEEMGRRSLEDTRKVVENKRKGLETNRKEVPNRISEQEKNLAELSKCDFDGAQAELDILTSRLYQMQKELLSIEQNTAVQAKQMELDAAKFELEKLEAENQRFRDHQRRTPPDTGRISEAIEKDKYALSSAESALDMRIREIARCDRMIDEIRKAWMDVNAEQYSGSDTCPTCGQKLPASQIDQAVKVFSDDKIKRLESLVEKSKAYKDLKAQCQKEAEDQKLYVANLERHIARNELELKEAKKAAAEAVTITDLPDYAEKKDSISKWISNTQRELEALRADSNAAARDLRLRISEVKAEIARVSEIAGKRSACEYAMRRIEELRRDARAAADMLGKLDKLLKLMDEFSRYKVRFVEDGINAYFRLAKFRLLIPQENGGVEDGCDATYDGVPYLNLNAGMKINVGIDIINTLSRAYGVTVPLFVDNAESVTELEECGCQVVRLVVSKKDKELRIEHEN